MTLTVLAVPAARRAAAAGTKVTGRYETRGDSCTGRKGAQEHLEAGFADLELGCRDPSSDSTGPRHRSKQAASMGLPEGTIDKSG
ncbi:MULTISPECIES: hypothetical protein [unclassified Bradyrhizobium]|uniref:hypothetical protein n=1 Tax=unclassified Bradyrhizobium TaxID=2631580 RepID=UPI001FDEC6B2|nr:MULTISPECIES: hypothetical protein [unclassified Bradyrhizobium]